MGTWTYQHAYYKPLTNAEIKKELIRHEFGNCEVHAISIPKWGEAYVVFSNPKYVAEPERKFMAVVKIACNSTQEIGFKVMGEECNPYYYNCPKKLLKMLPATDYEYAKEWRKECWKKFKKGVDKA